jgi:protein FAM50
LSFNLDEDEGDEEEESDKTSPVPPEIKPEVKQEVQSDAEEEEEESYLTLACSAPVPKKIRKNPDVDTSFLPDREREEEDNRLREELRQVNNPNI